MSGDANFDPYHSWLGIHPSEHPADCYRLLGVCRFEADTTVIQAAYDQRLAYLTRFNGTRQESAAFLLARELTSAYTTLVNPMSKTSYDQMLAGVQAPPITQQAAPSAMPPSNEHHVEQDAWHASEPATSSYIPSQSPKPRGRRVNAQVAMYGQLIASVVGLLIGYLVLCFIKPEYDGLGLFHVVEAPQRRERTKTADVPRSPEKTTPNEQRFKPRAFPGRPNANANRPARRPGVAPQQRAQGPAAPNGEIVDVPRYAALPPRDSGEQFKVGTVRSVGLKIDLNNPDGNPIKLEIVKGDSPDHWTIVNGQWIIATLERRSDGQLTFSWGENVPLGGEALRNCILTVRAGNRVADVYFREPRSIDPPILNMNDEVTSLPVEVDLHDFDPQSLMLEIQDVIHPGVKVTRFEPATRQASGSVWAYLRDEAPFAAIDIELSNLGDKVRIMPTMAGDTKVYVPWTFKRLKGSNLTGAAALTELASSIDGKATVRFRVFYTAEGREVDVIRTDGAPKVAEAPVEDALQPGRQEPRAGGRRQLTGSPWPRTIPPAQGRFGVVMLSNGESFSDSRVILDKKEFDKLFSAENLRRSKNPLYVEYFPDKKLALAITFAPSLKKAQLEGPAISMHESGLPRMLAFYQEDDLAGPLRIFDKAGRLELFGEFKNGKRHGIWAYFVNGWPVVIQEWKNDLLQDQSVVVGSAAIGGDECAFGGLSLVIDFATAQFDHLYRQVINDEKRVHAGVTKWYLEQAKKQRTEIGRRNGIAGRNNQVQLIAANESQQAASFQKAWQDVTSQVSSALNTLQKHPAGILAPQ